ncbi:hypothetical protein BM1_00482 [Bipolaris maydis]|nr:hypothetical protein BM1_00482 [Bipolaris maydis]
MDSRAGDKRPWENEESISVQTKRRSSILAASLPQQVSPLPPQAGFFARDSPALDRRVLPPLLASSHSISACPVTIASQCSPPLPPLGLKLSTIPSLIPEPRASPPRAKRAVDPDPIPQQVSAPRPVTCCPPDCRGQVCSNSRSLMHKLATDLGELVHKVNDLTRTELQVLSQPPTSSHAKVEELLQWALDRVHEGNIRLQEHLEQEPIHTTRLQSPPEDSPDMRRAQHHLEEREEQSPPRRPYPFHHEYGYSTHSNASPEDSRRNPYGIASIAVGGSPQQTAAPSGAMYMLPQSPPTQATQPVHPTILPSPSSLNFSSSQSLSSMTPPITYTHASAQNTLLQDLQHQVTIKTLEFRTLQREYDNLLQKLERQKTKCATLEKKFEVSDCEINSLTDEKEKLQSQVVAFEGQVEELQQSRDEARRQLIANGAQYMRIMEMANRLQSQGADDKKKWDIERMELEQRIRVLEEAMVTGDQHHVTLTPGSEHHATSNYSPVPGESTPQNHAPSSSSQTETVNVLRAEINRLRSRTQTLESAVRTMQRESKSIQTAAQQLVDSSERVKDAARDIIGDGK